MGIRLLETEYAALTLRREAAAKAASVPVAAFSSREDTLPQGKPSRVRQKRLTQAEYIAEMHAAKLESEVVDEICQRLETRGIVYTKSEAKKSYNEQGKIVRRLSPGWPDISAILPSGQFLGIEAKRAAGGRLSYEQAAMLKRLHDSGALIVIARSVDDLENALAHGTRQCDLDEIEERLRK